MKKTAIATIAALLLALRLTPTAWAQELMAGGQAVGIQIRTEGVMVAGVAPVETREGRCSPAEDAGLREGEFFLQDIIGAEVFDEAGEKIGNRNTFGTAFHAISASRTRYHIFTAKKFFDGFNKLPFSLRYRLEIGHKFHVFGNVLYSFHTR